MRVATYAASIGRAVPFAQAAFRQAFAGGHSLEDPDFVLIAAAACEMHPAAVLRGAELRSVGGAARRPPPRRGAGRASREVPAIVATRHVFVGEDVLERAAERMRAEWPREPLDGARDRVVKADRAYRLIVTRGGRAPALLADPTRVDHIEVVEIDSGEVVLFWDRAAAGRVEAGARAARGAGAAGGGGVHGALEYRGALMAAAPAPSSPDPRLPQPATRASGWRR